MIFSVSLDWLLDGKKTETRWPVKAGEWFDPERQAVIGANGRLKWRVGGNYAVQPGRGKPAIARYDLGSLRQERLQEITEAGARAEGCDRENIEYFEPLHIFLRTGPLVQYKAIWESLGYPPSYRWDANPLVWVLGGIKITHRQCKGCNQMLEEKALTYHERSLSYLCGECYDWITTINWEDI